MPRKKKALSHKSDPRPLVERAIATDGKTGRATRSVTVNLAESPLCWLHSRGFLTDRQLLAGEKLRETFEAACLGPRITMSWENIPVSRSKGSAPAAMQQSERMICAKDRFDAAMLALGSDLSDIAWRVICSGEGVSLAEKQMGWPSRSGKLVLGIALNRLADYYRISA